jgi:hypothetical protein
VKVLLDMNLSPTWAPFLRSGPSVLQVRVQDTMPDAIGHDVLRVLRFYAEALTSGALVTRQEQRSRAHPPVPTERRPRLTERCCCRAIRVRARLAAERCNVGQTSAGRKRHPTFCHFPFGDRAMDFADRPVLAGLEVWSMDGAVTLTVRFTRSATA